MLEIKELVAQKTEAMITDGTLEKMIEEKLKESVASAVNDSFRSYSDFGKALSEKISNSIGTAARDIELPEYNSFIASVVKDRFTEALHDQALNSVTKLIEDDLKPIQGVQTVQNILDEVEKQWGDTAKEHGKDEIEIEISESESEALYVTFKHPEYDWYDIKVTFYKFGNDENYHIGYISQNDKRMTHSVDGITHAGELARYFFRLYAVRADIDCTTSEFESIYISEY